MCLPDAVLPAFRRLGLIRTRSPLYRMWLWPHTRRAVDEAGVVSAAVVNTAVVAGAGTCGVRLLGGAFAYSRSVPLLPAYPRKEKSPRLRGRRDSLLKYDSDEGRSVAQGRLVVACSLCYFFSADVGSDEVIAR